MFIFIFLEGIIGYNPMGLLCTQLVSVLNHANAELPFVVTAFPAL